MCPAISRNFSAAHCRLEQHIASVAQACGLDQSSKLDEAAAPQSCSAAVTEAHLQVEKTTKGQAEDVERGNDLGQQVVHARWVEDVGSAQESRAVVPFIFFLQRAPVPCPDR